MTDDVIAEARELLKYEGDSPTERKMQLVIACLIARVEASQIVWSDAKPTEIPDDGRVWLVILDPKWCGEYGIEYHGGPVAVSCWGHKLKTTIDAIRIDPDAVIAWMPYPIPHPADTREGDETR